MLFKQSQETSFCLYVCFLNVPKKVVFVRMYESTIIGLVEPPYPYCSLVAFCAFAWLRLCAFSAFDAFGAFLCFWCVQNLFVKQKKVNKEFKTVLIPPFTI